MIHRHLFRALTAFFLAMAFLLPGMAVSAAAVFWGVVASSRTSTSGLPPSVSPAPSAAGFPAVRSRPAWTRP